MLTVVITGVGFPGDEGQGGVATVQAGQPAPRAEHVHLDRLGRKAQQAGDFLGLSMLSDQPKNLPLSRSQPLKAQVVTRVHHAAKMVRGSPDVQQDLTDRVRAVRDPSNSHRISLRRAPFISLA
nr:hypothetical protein [Caulobacter soli]